MNCIDFSTYQLLNAGNRRTCPNTSYVCLDLLSDMVLDEIQKLIQEAKSNGFWNKITVAKSIELQKTIQD